MSFGFYYFTKPSFSFYYFISVVNCHFLLSLIFYGVVKTRNQSYTNQDKMIRILNVMFPYRVVWQIYHQHYLDITLVKIKYCLSVLRATDYLLAVLKLLNVNYRFTFYM